MVQKVNLKLINMKASGLIQVFWRHDKMDEQI